MVSGAPIIGVRLKAYSQGDEGIVVKPRKDSYVLVAFLSPTDAFLVMYDLVDSIDVKIGDTTLKVDKDHITMNGGALKGLTKLEKLVSRLNAIEDAHNKLLTEYKNHVHAGVMSGSGSTALMVPPSSQMNVEKSNIDDLENKKITHG